MAHHDMCDMNAQMYMWKNVLVMCVTWYLYVGKYVCVSYRMCREILKWNTYLVEQGRGVWWDPKMTKFNLINIY